MTQIRYFAHQASGTLTSIGPIDPVFLAPRGEDSKRHFYCGFTGLGARASLLTAGLPAEKCLLKCAFLLEP